LAIACHPLIAQAEAAGGAGRHAVLVVDANTGRVLHERSADAPRFPASLVKLMTLFMIFELMEQGKLAPDSKVRFSANAAAAPPSRLDVEPGTEITVMDAVKALITKSANDVAVAVAEHIAGSEERFAELMNRKARELGMKSTVLRNASGLPDPEQVTTARDMITLAFALQDRFPRHYPLFATRTFSWGGETFRNHNTLLFRYRGLDGMKTGYTRASGFNLVASARRGTKHVVAAYFGGTTAALRNAAVRQHLDAGLGKASERKTRVPAPPVAASTRIQAKATTPAERPASVPDTRAAREVASAPAPTPAQRPVQRLASAPGVEVVRVRPVHVAGTVGRGGPLEETEAQSDATQAPASIEALLKQPTPTPRAPAQEDAAPREGGAPEPTAQPTAQPTGPFQVQVGAYQTQGEAERQLAWVRERAGTVLGRHAGHMSQVKRGDKVFFRARYGGFDAHAAAADVCGALKRLEIDCLVMRAE
jgi:D-alanyl-D-alanine carboxypeptidase